MPRLTTHDYLTIRATLREFWLCVMKRYGWLSPRVQWNLHDYFRPSEDLDELALVAHRRAITKQRPSLPHSAGRAWRRFQYPRDLPATTMHTGGRHLRVLVVVRPVPDVELIARALVDKILRDAQRDDDQPAA